MPLFEFVCAACGVKFEEIVDSGKIPPCPECGASAVERQISAPSPFKTGDFPYKPGPVCPTVRDMPSCGMGGCCGPGGCPGGAGEV
ncbi:MAG: zinc ribbon domain-containing protein [Desulfovibrio sp.]|jgi:putative FmdB family regulatory protein|nr:zinc ribbon domain-containing protein [Desulfovibrio sp.]